MPKTKENLAKMVEDYLIEHAYNDGAYTLKKGLTTQTKKIINKEWAAFLEKNSFSQTQKDEIMDSTARMVAYYFLLNTRGQFFEQKKQNISNLKENTGVFFYWSYQSRLCFVDCSYFNITFISSFVFSAYRVWNRYDYGRN